MLIVHAILYAHCMISIVAIIIENGYRHTVYRMKSSLK